MDLSTEVFRSNKSGVKSEFLVLFGNPLCDIYDISEKDLVSFLKGGSNKQQSCVAALTMSRLLWAYFDLSDEHRVDALSSLIQYCVGDSATEKEIGEVTDLLILMNERWSKQDPLDKVTAEKVPGYRTLSYFEFIDYAYSLTTPQLEEDEFEYEESSFDGEKISLPEAMAMFSSKLLDEVDNPEELDQATILASAYWDLCHSIDSPDLFEETLNSIILELASSEGDRKKIKSQAHEMVAYYLTLFPEKTSPGVRS